MEIESRLVVGGRLRLHLFRLWNGLEITSRSSREEDPPLGMKNGDEKRDCSNGTGLV